MKKLLSLILLFFFCITNAQVVINELDSDTPGTDTMEFIELKSETPNFPLDGYVLVFYNASTSGTSALSYLAIDLDNYSTDVNGIIHFGNPLVSPTPAIIIPNNTIQNGPDGVALYLGDAVDFPTNTIAHTTGLVNAFVYTNTNSNPVYPTTLMNTFGITTCYYDFQPTGSTSKSMQRKADGTFEYKTPTPGMNNDGSGIVLTYLTMTTNYTTMQEGQNLIITYTSSQPVSGSNLVINFSLTNGNFTTSDYSGVTSVTIPVGSTTGSTSILILNDGSNDGDKELKITASSLATGYSLYNNNLIVRVNDINYTVLPFGKPSTPTYGQVSNMAPAGYYSSLEGLSGTALKQALQNIIANPAVVRAHTYGDIIDILKTADQNPENNNQVYLIYTEQPRSKIDYQVGNSIIGKWNREHIYCQSRGNYGNLYNLPPSGINNYSLSGPNDIGAGLSDAHHLRAVDGQENSSRNNRNYGIDYNGPTGNPGTWKGDVARACFYMAVRYNGLNVVNGNPNENIVGQIGDLASLLAWNQSDPSDDFEMNRNNYIYTWQKNRNPFIDYPSLANYIWGSQVGQPWYAALSTTQHSELNFVLYPNPTKDNFAISGLNGTSKIEIYNSLGMLVHQQIIDGSGVVSFNLATGVYMAKIASENKTAVRKIIVE
jgi:hypothetical protein